MNVLIKNANIDDAKRILELQKTSFYNQARIYNNFKILPLTQSLEELQKEIGEKIFLKAV